VQVIARLATFDLGLASHDVLENLKLGHAANTSAIKREKTQRPQVLHIRRRSRILEDLIRARLRREHLASARGERSCPALGFGCARVDVIDGLLERGCCFGFLGDVGELEGVDVLGRIGRCSCRSARQNGRIQLRSASPRIAHTRGRLERSLDDLQLSKPIRLRLSIVNQLARSRVEANVLLHIGVTEPGQRGAVEDPGLGRGGRDSSTTMSNQLQLSPGAGLLSRRKQARVKS